MFFTSYDLFVLQDTGPHVSAINFIIELSLESVEEWVSGLLCGKKIGVFISSNIWYFNVETMCASHYTLKTYLFRHIWVFIVKYIVI